MARGIFAGILLAVSNLLAAQEFKIDTAELKYNSAFERQAFADYIAKKPDYFALFLAVDESVTSAMYTNWKTGFDKTLAALETEFASKKKNDKKARFLYEKVHSSFLTKYEEINVFSQVFKNGVYNCVSATALYSLVFERFSIPYAIQERPTHVYLVAYPNEDRVQIETTTPVGGYRIFDQAFKQQFVKKLTEYKLISSSEYQSQSVDDLFDQYFFNNEVVNIGQLAGIQYYNSALSYADKDEKEKALEQFEKYYFLYPSEKARFLIFSLTGEIFNSLTYENDKKAEYLVRICKFTREGITHDAIISEFYRITQFVFMQNGDRVKYEKIYKLLMNSVTSEDVRTQLTYIYNYENGRILYNQSRYNDAIPYFEKALAAKPNSVDMSNLFIGNLTLIRKNAKDKQAFIVQLQQYAEKYPGLKQDNNFFELQGSVMLEVFGTAYEKGNIQEGEKYRLMFEDLVVKNPDAATDAVSYEIGKAYSLACVYYFKRNQRAKAKTFVDKGLTYAPDSYELRARKEMLN
jgi:hypothetical protein